MKITIIGAGYVGLVTGACLAEVGNDVFCLDMDQARIDYLNDGGMPIHEIGLDDLVSRNRAAKRLFFSSDTAAGVAHGDVLFIAVGTPPDEDGSADLRYVQAAARHIGKHMDGFKAIVNKSTVPVGTAEKVWETIQAELNVRGSDARFAVLSNPEFLKEGAAVEDFMRPDRIVIGCDNTPEGMQAQMLMRQLYAPFNRHRERTFWMDVRSAEFTKYAANAMLATRISFMNELANLSDMVGADIEAVRHGIGSDPRIGYSFLYAGCGYGGSCFPKDLQALERIAHEQGQSLRILRAVEEVNVQQKHVLGIKIALRFGKDLSGRHFALWGLAFKPNTNDMREAPSRVLLRQLIERGATAAVFDPIAAEEAKRVFALDFAGTPELLSRIHFCDSPMEALKDADALAIVTEWKSFRSPDFTQMKSLLKAPVIFDGRNLFSPQVMLDAGIEYHGIGRSASAQS
ncbi:MAG TPA: UDP-glucose/GDP-mannose dehydrogenase family protein [Noviherbaspirillum sp.]|nr:UDP-glucose/GDP-mannose dehydrogenase family protein [Noviherbaspirillum sp.]